MSPLIELFMGACHKRKMRGRPASTAGSTRAASAVLSSLVVFLTMAHAASTQDSVSIGLGDEAFKAAVIRIANFKPADAFTSPPDQSALRDKTVSLTLPFDQLADSGLDSLGRDQRSGWSYDIEKSILHLQLASQEISASGFSDVYTSIKSQALLHTDLPNILCASEHRIDTKKCNFIGEYSGYFLQKFLMQDGSYTGDNGLGSVITVPQVKSWNIGVAAMSEDARAVSAPPNPYGSPARQPLTKDITLPSDQARALTVGIHLVVQGDVRSFPNGAVLNCLTQPMPPMSDAVGYTETCLVNVVFTRVSIVNATGNTLLSWPGP